MPWLRHKRWQYATPLAPLVTMCGSGRAYRCTGADGGAVLVSWLADVNELLDPLGDRSADWEVAWDVHGVKFTNGIEVDPDRMEETESPSPALEHEPKKRGRPRKG
jgi:hypothetical protein